MSARWRELLIIAAYIYNTRVRIPSGEFITIIWGSTTKQRVGDEINYTYIYIVYNIMNMYRRMRLFSYTLAHTRIIIYTLTLAHAGILYIVSDAVD